MNKIIPILIIFLLVMSSFAFAVWEEIPKVITIQGKLTDATDDPVTDGNYDFEFDFTPNADGSSPPYIYTKEDFSVYNGIFSILVPIDTSKINFDQALYVQVKVKGPLDESYQTLKPTAQITSSGYAFTASAANDFNVRGTATVGGKTTLKSDLQVDGKTGLGINNPSEKLDVIGNIYVGGNGYVTISGDAIRSSAPFGFFGDDENPATDDWTAQIIHTGGILAVKSGEAYADYKTAIPNGGIYSRGNILTAGSISDPDSEVTINDDLKINTIDLSTTATNTLVNDGNVVKQRAPDSRVWGTTLTDGAGSSGYIAYWSDANSLTYANTKLFWDVGNNRLGIGNNAPTTTLDVSGKTKTTTLQVTGGTTTDGYVLTSDGSGNAIWEAVISDHGLLGGLGDDDHTQYANLTGRSGGQTLKGGTANSNSLTLESTSATTKGYIILQPNGGNVGIGTIDPGAKLDVRGNFILEQEQSPEFFTGTGNIELNRYVMLLNSPLLTTASGLKAGGILVSDTYAYANPGKNDLIVKGNVGIGISIPTQKLDVIGNIKASSSDSWTSDDANDVIHIVKTGSSESSTGGRVGLKIYDSANTNKATGLYAVSESDWANSVGMALYTGGGTYSEKVRISSGGNVGIGTTSPDTKLMVYGDNAFIKTKSVGNADNGFSIFKTNVVEYRMTTSGSDLIFGQYSTGDNDGTRLTIKANTGNVGIGTSTPINKLDIRSATNEIVKVGIGTTANGYNGGQINFYGAGGAELSNIIGGYGPTGTDNSYISFITKYPAATAGEVMRIVGGNVGIGKTDPATKLDVDGTITAGGENIPGVYSEYIGGFAICSASSVKSGGGGAITLIDVACSSTSVTAWCNDGYMISGGCVGTGLSYNAPNSVTTTWSNSPAITGWRCDTSSAASKTIYIHCVK